MATAVGINGFGRIGRYLLRLLADDKDLPVVMINARGDNKSLAHLFKYDSVHGHFNGSIDYNDKGLIVNGREIIVTRDNEGAWQFGKLGADMVIETSGTQKSKKGGIKMMDAGAKKVIISAPVEDADLTVVMGANHDVYDPATHNVLSAASCTTNCLAPAAKYIHQTLGIKHGLVTSVHSYTMSQRLLDGTYKDLRRARAAAMSIIPTTTGAAAATGLVVPELKGKLDGMAIRVPTPNVSLVDMNVELKTKTTAEEVNAILKAASEGPLKGNMGYTDEPLVSCDFLGSIYGGVVDALCTHVMDDTFLKAIIWYDNEAGFTNQLVRLMRMVAKDM